VLAGWIQIENLRREAEPLIRIVLFFQFVTAMPMESRLKAIS
jgi:hypothetical protein